MLLLLAAFLPLGAVAENKLLRYPDIHNDLVVFVHGGDIWRVPVSGGEATRLTSHPGLELFPKFSPDGRWIAFTGQYEGDEQVYVMPASGGEPRRLTSYPAAGPLPARWGYDNQVVGWSADGLAVLFRSHRDHFSVSNSRLYTVPVNGGLPSALPMKVAGAGSLSPDGRSVFYTPLSRDFRTWKRYEGGWAQDLWIYDLEGNTSTNITAHRRTDRDPMWTDAGLFFVSDRDDYLNLYTVDESGSSVRQLTDYKSDVRWASADRSGNIVYELDGELRIYDARKAGDRGISIAVPSDSVSTRPRSISVGGQLEHFAISPNGARVAIVARGDVFSVPVEKGVTRNLTQSSTAHDRLATWSPDSTTIAYVSDRSGEEQLWLVDALGQQAPRRLITDQQTRFVGLSWAPNGTQLAVSDMHGSLFVIDVDGGSIRKVGELGAYYNQDFAWSPDSRYIAYSALNDTFLFQVQVWDAGDGQTHSVTSRYFNSFAPAWHPTGEYLYYLSDRELSPQIGSFEWNYVVDRETFVYALALSPDSENPYRPGNDEALAAGISSSDDEEPDIQIELEGIQERVIRVPVDADNYTALAVSAEQLVLYKTGPAYYGRRSGSESGLQVFSIEEQETEPLTAGADPITGFDMSSGGDFVLVQQGGDLSRFSLSDTSSQSVAVSTAGLVSKIVPKEEWATIFDEVWRRFRDFFYVDNMHGYDWNALREEYRQLLPHVSHRSDLNYLLGEMISELNVSHAYVFGGDTSQVKRPVPALLGAEFEFDARSETYRISRVLAGDNSEDRYRSPLTEVGIDVNVGDFILKINGRTLSRSLPPFAVLRDSGGSLIELLVNDGPTLQGARTELVNPVSSEASLRYLEWTTRNREFVRRQSDGRVGYLHIPNMGGDGIREFIKWYYGQIRSDGLIIDVRGNAGGNVSQMILERLLRKHYSTGYVKGEKYPRTYPWGVGGAKVFTGELAVIADQTTLSDGDAFTWTFKQAARGPIIGMRTWGGVVGIDNTGPVLDGGGMNVPQFPLADSKGQWVVEGEGVLPDVVVENSPASLVDGHDLQLERAVQNMLNTLGEDSPGRLPNAATAPVKTP